MRLEARGEEMREIHLLATFVHGSLSALHFLGSIYNLRRKSWWDFGIHVGATLYSVKSALHHAKESREV